MKKARIQGWLGLAAEAGRAVLIYAVVLEIAAMVLVLGWIHGIWVMACVPPVIAMVILASLHLSRQLLLAPQAPIAEPVSSVPEGLVVQTESWGGAHGSAAVAFVVALAAFAVAAVGDLWALAAVLSLASVGVAVAGRIAAEQLQRTTELRLTEHSLEVWRDSAGDGSPRRRHRFLLHEIEEIEVLVDVDISEHLPRGARCRWLCITDESGKLTELRLPMDVQSSDGFLAKLRELVAQARDVQPDEDALSRLRSIGRRAQPEG